MHFFCNFILIIILSLTPVHSTGVGYLGCFREYVKDRHFEVCVGDYNPEILTTNRCRAQCAVFDFGFAAMTDGKFCFCSKTITPQPVVVDANCDVPCAGNTGENCGGKVYVSVYNSVGAVEGLEVIADPGNVTEAPILASLAVTVMKGVNPQYQVDYGDGAGFTGVNEANQFKRQFYLPGAYKVIVTATDILQMFPKQYASVVLQLEEGPQLVDIKCDPIFVTYEKSQCQVTIWRGSNLRLEAEIPGKSITTVIPKVSDPRMELTGLWSSSPGGTANAVDTSRSILLVSTAMGGVGKLYGLRVHVSRIGVVNFMVLTPKCLTGSYCLTSNTCLVGTCPSMHSTVSKACTGPEIFCFQQVTCTTSCSHSSRFGNGEITVDSYEATYVITQNFGVTGENFVTIDPPVDVMPGDIVAIEEDGTVKGKVSVVDTTDDDDVVKTYQASAVGVTFNNAGGIAMSARHMVQPLVSYGSKVTLQYTLKNPDGVFPINVKVTNNRGFGTVVSNSTDINLLEGVNYAIIVGLMYVKTGEETVFTAVEHTGNGVTYRWNVSNGFTQSSSNDTFKYTFSTPGSYNLSLEIYNLIGQKENVTEIIVQDEISDLSITTENNDANFPSVVNITLASGTVNNCTVDYGDQTPVVVYTPPPNAGLEYSLSHTYTSQGIYNLTITCSNDVSSNTSTAVMAILEAITNLRLLTLGSATHQPFRLVWEIDTGSYVSFDFKLDGNPITIDPGKSDAATYHWESTLMSGLPANGYPYELNATNILGSKAVSGTFVVLDPIVNPRISSDLNDVTTDDTVKFTIHMDSGSNVSIVVDFMDGFPNETYFPPTIGAAWNTPWVFNHKFGIGCNCRVTAYLSNAAGSFEIFTSVLVKVGFATFFWNFADEDYYLYEPPALIESLVMMLGPYPTDPTFRLDWGDGSPEEVTNTILLSPDGYKWQYDDTGTYWITLDMSNQLSSRTFTHKAIVVEKLVGPGITLEFPSAPLNKPFDITFSLFRGDKGNLTILRWDFGDGNTPIITERTGYGKDGSDTLSVTYTTLGSKTVTVTATAPLNQTVTATKTFDVINGVDSPSITVTSNGDVDFGVPSQFTIKYSTSPLPDNAKIEVDWFGDGSLVTTIGPMTIAGAGGTQSFPFTYAKDGLHKAKIKVVNDASEVIVESKVGVYKDFINEKADASYIPDSVIPNPDPMFGMLDVQNLFPLDKPVYFKFSDDNNAFASSYDIVSTSQPAGGDIIATFAYNNFPVNFTEEGTYTLEITARNPLYSANVSKTIQLVTRVKGLNVTEEESQVSPGKRKSFKFAFDGYGSDTCVYIDWGDLNAKTKYGNNLGLCTDQDFATAEEGGDMDDLLQHYVGYRYLREGVYTITIVAKNAHGSENLKVTFPVAYRICSSPELSIHNQEDSIFYAPKYKQSEIIRILGLANIDCPDSFENVKMWRVEMVNDTGHSLPYPSLNVSGLELTKAELYIPAHFLELGSYRAMYIMSMIVDGEGVEISTNTSTFFKVVQSDLMAIMVEGGLTELTLGTTQTLTLEPLKWSIDADMDPTDPQGLSIDGWECEVLKSADQSGCSQIVTSAVSTQTIDGSQWDEGMLYKIKVHLSKDIRKATTELDIWVNGTDPRRAFIKCVDGSVCYQQSDGYRGLESSRVSLDCECRNCRPGSRYQWKVYIRDYRWPERWRPIREGHLVNKSITTDDETCGYGDPTCVFSKALSLQKILFYTYKDVADVYKLQCIIQDGNTITKVTTNININRPPKDGNCTISPSSATATIDNEKQWTVLCWGWKDEDGIKDFQITSFFAEDEIEKEITSFPTTWSGIYIPVSLPAGPSYRNHQQDIYVYIKDSLNAVTRRKVGTVTVYPAGEQELRQFVNMVVHDDSNEFYKLLHEGDQRSVCELTTNMALALGNSQELSEDEFSSKCVVPGTWLNTGYGPSSTNRDNIFVPFPDSASFEEQLTFDQIKDNRAQLRSTMTDFLLELAVDDISSIQQVTGALAEITAKPTELAFDTQMDIATGLDKILDNLADPIKMKNVPQEDIQKAMSYIYASVGGVIDASGASGTFPTLKDMEETKKDDSWKVYDTSNVAIGDKTDVSRSRSYDEAVRQHTLNKHKLLSVDKSSSMANLTAALLDKLAGLFEDFAIPGQVQESTGYRSKYRLEKNFAENFVGQEITLKDSSASVTLPDSLTDLFPSGSVGSEDEITFQVVQGTNTAKRYTPKALQYFPLEAHTHFVYVDFFDKSGQRIDVAQTKKPIRIVVPNDPHAPKPDKKIVLPLVTEHNRFMLHETASPSPESNLQLRFEVEENIQLVVVARYNGIPNPVNNETDFIWVIPPTLPSDSSDLTLYTVIINKEKADGRVGKWVFGVIERDSAFHNMPVPDNQQVAERYQNGSGEFTHYNLTILASGCFYYKQGAEDWDTDGCVVSKETDNEKTVCMCNHLTTFAGGLIVVPNVIDWNYVFANADFMSNPTLYVSEMMIFAMFFIGFLFARRKDVSDVTKRGLAPLADNKLDDTYLYEVIVSTGMRRNAGTTSRVFFIMSGEDDETEIRIFSDSKREIFKRGMTNGFLMVVPKCLGHINYIRIWHDNSGEGKFGSWFLSYIAVKDLQTNDKQVFVLNRWLAVEEDDGQLDRIIPLANREQLSDFSYQFGERSKKNLLDDHLWFSLVARPPSSRFSCVERVACCMCLLFMTMMTNAMFYDVQENNSTSSSTSFDIGPFSLSVSQISIGFISTIIVFPVNFLLVFLFRKSQSRTVASSRDEDKDGKSSTSASQIHLRPLSRLSTNSNESEKSGTTKDTITLTAKRPVSARTKKKFMLPWWCVIIAWIVLIILTLGSAAMVTFYGITFKDETCKKWIASLIVSFLTSIFITQPIKVILLAIFLSLIIKNPGEDQDEEEEEDDIVVVDDKQEFLHAQDGIERSQINCIVKKPLSTKQLAKIREQRLKEVQMWAVIREIIFYLFFLWILMVIAHRNRSPDNFHYKNSMYRTFIKSLDTKLNFESIRGTNDFWTWAKSGLVGGLLAGSYYNDYPPLRLRAYINDKSSRILGYAVLRQNRIRPNLCELSDHFEYIIHECNTLYEMDGEEKRDFDVGWDSFGTSPNGSTPEYHYSSAESLNGYPYWGYRGIYSGGGYVVHLRGSKQTVLELMTRLESEKWIDRYTRSVFVEFTVYNPQVNLFSVNLLLAEFDTTNGIVTSYRFEPAMLLPYNSGTMIFQLLCEVVFLIYLIFFIVSELKNLHHQRLRYFIHFWNLVEMCIIGLSFTAVVIYFYRLYETDRLTSQFKKSQGNDYIKFQYVSYWNEIFAYIIGFIVFFATLKFLRLLRFNQRVSMLSNTIKYSRRSLLHFGVIATIVFLAFCQLFFITFMTVDEKYSSFIESVVASILMMMGKFNIYHMIMAEPILTQMFVLAFVIAMTFIIVNMFISILNDAFGEVRSNLQNQSNEYEIIEFILQRFQKWLGFGVFGDKNKKPDENGKDSAEGDKPEGKRRVNSQIETEMQMYPERIEHLLQSLSMATIMNTSYDAKKTTRSHQGMKRPFAAPQSTRLDENVPWNYPKPTFQSNCSSPEMELDHRRVSLARVDTE